MAHQFTALRRLLTPLYDAQLISKIRDHRSLLSAFLHKESRFHKLLKTFPLYAVTHERTGLLGTREYAIRLLGQPSLIKAT